MLKHFYLNSLKLMYTAKEWILCFLIKLSCESDNNKKQWLILTVSISIHSCMLFIWGKHSDPLFRKRDCIKWGMSVFILVLFVNPVLGTNIQKGWRKCTGIGGTPSGDSHEPRGACFGENMIWSERATVMQNPWLLVPRFFLFFCFFFSWLVVWSWASCRFSVNWGVGLCDLAVHVKYNTLWFVNTHSTPVS